MAKIRLFIDLGSFRTVIYRDKIGIVLNEPTKVLYQNVGGVDKIVDYGQKAVKISRQEGQYLVSPIMEGVITDERACASMLREFLRRVMTDKPNATVEAYFSIPCGTTIQDKQKFFNAGYTAGISKLTLIPAPIADIVGCGVGFDDFEYCALVDIGSGCTDIAILGSEGIVQGFTINIGSVSIDLAIINHIQSKYGVKIALQNAVSLKEQIGSLIPNGTKALSVTGTEIKTGATKTINATGFDILDALREYYQVIADSLSSLLSASEAEVCAKVRAQGVIFCGNGSKIEGLNQYMAQRLGLPVYIAQGERTVFGMQTLSQNRTLQKRVL